MNNALDLLEVILKDDLKISLTTEEKAYLDTFDDELKQPIYELVNSDCFLEQIEIYTNHIIKKASVLSKEEQKNIKQKCENRVQYLKQPRLLQETLNVKVLK